MDRRITQLAQAANLTLQDILVLVQPGNTTQSPQGSTMRANLLQLIGLIKQNLNPAVENSYLTISQMLADQDNQNSGQIQYVGDASADPTVTSGYAYYEYLGGLNASLSDYRKLSKQEGEGISDFLPTGGYEGNAQDIINRMLPEVPSDNKIYGIKNGEWVEISTVPQIIHVTNVTVSPSTYSLVYNQTVLAIANVSPANATDKTGVWTSSNTSVCTVSSNGLITAVGAGNAIITFTANDGGFHSDCSIIASVNKHYVRPTGQVYGNGTGVSYENAWSGLNNIEWNKIGVENTLSVCGNYSETFAIQNDHVIIELKDIAESAYFDMTGKNTGISITGKTGVIVNNPRVDNAIVQNFIITDSTVIINDGDCNNSGNQSFQTMGNSHVTYNNIKSHGNGDESISIHGNGTLILNGTIDFQNNVQAGINYVDTSKLVINGNVIFANNLEADIMLSGSNTDKSLMSLTINNQGKLDNFGRIVVDGNPYATINLNGGTYDLVEFQKTTLNANKCIINSLVRAGNTDNIINIEDSLVSSFSALGSVSIIGDYNFINSRINTGPIALKYYGSIIAKRSLFYNNSAGMLIDAVTGDFDFQYCLFINPVANQSSITVRSGVNSIKINNITIDGKGVARGVLSEIDAIINNTIIVNTKNSALNGSGATITANNCLLDGNAVDVLGNVIHNSQVFGDPLFSDVANLDYSLSSGSPAIDSGMTTVDAIGILSANWNASLPIISEKTQIAPFDLGAVIT